jgi:hypothetical protein
MEWVVSVTPRPRFTQGKGPTVPIVQEAGWETLLLLQENKTYHVIYEVIMAASLKMTALLEYSSVWFCKS